MNRVIRLLVAFWRWALGPARSRFDAGCIDCGDPSAAAGERCELCAWWRAIK